MKYKDMVHKGSVIPKSDYKVVVGDTAEKIKMEEEITTLKKKIQHLEDNMQGTYRPVKGNANVTI